MADLFGSYVLRSAWDGMVSGPGVPRAPYQRVLLGQPGHGLRVHEERELLEVTRTSVVETSPARLSASLCVDVQVQRLA